jgi:hypothetical protein
MISYLTTFNKTFEFTTAATGFIPTVFITAWHGQNIFDFLPILKMNN